MKNISLLALTVLTISLLVTSCRPDEKTRVLPTPKGMLYLHMHSMIDTTEIASGDTAVDANGRHIRLNIAEFYIFGITLRKADGSTVVLPNACILKQLGEEEYYIDSVVAGNYVSVSFNVGIDAATNVTNPSSYPSTSPLSEQTPDMWFGTPSQGYIFMSIAGLADTTAAQTGAVNFPFSYRTGTSDMLRTVTLSGEPIVVVANQPALLHVAADFGKALNGVTFKGNTTATPWLNTSVVTQIANNIPTMFSYEH